MGRAISSRTRQMVAERANFKCEYCGLPEKYAMYPFEVDHVVAVKHGGSSVVANLAYCCIRCNRAKGSDLATILPGINEIVRLFNPRIDVWGDHFSVQHGEIVGKTPIGNATVRLLAFNSPERVLGRKLLQDAGLYL